MLAIVLPKLLDSSVVKLAPATSRHFSRSVVRLSRPRMCHQPKLTEKGVRFHFLPEGLFIGGLGQIEVVVDIIFTNICNGKAGFCFRLVLHGDGIPDLEMVTLRKLLRDDYGVFIKGDRLAVGTVAEGEIIRQSGSVGRYEDGDAVCRVSLFRHDFSVVLHDGEGALDTFFCPIGFLEIPSLQGAGIP